MKNSPCGVQVLSSITWKYLCKVQLPGIYSEQFLSQCTRSNHTELRVKQETVQQWAQRNNTLGNQVRSAKRMPPPPQNLSTSSVEVFVIQLNKVASSRKTTPTSSAWRAGVGVVEGLRLHLTVNRFA